MQRENKQKSKDGWKKEERESVKKDRQEEDQSSYLFSSFRKL